jgi:hypothetical protein
VGILGGALLTALVLQLITIFVLTTDIHVLRGDVCHIATAQHLLVVSCRR